MFRLNKPITTFTVFVIMCFHLACFGAQLEQSNNCSTCIQKQSLKTDNKSPDYAQEFLGEDKFEKFNRKMYAFNSNLNKYALRPMHVIWASVMPKYGMDRIEGIYENVLYPRRLVSTLIQRKFRAAGDETIRFLTNSTVGLGGMFDPAKRYLKIEPTDADMEQALSSCKVKQGAYVVCPVLSASSPRALIGKALDAALDPSSYIGIPVIALAKLGFSINRTAFAQPMSVFLEANYADPYDVVRKIYGIESYIKNKEIVEKAVSGEVVDFSEEIQFPVGFLSGENLPDGIELNCLNCLDCNTSNSICDELIAQTDFEGNYVLLESEDEISENTQMVEATKEEFPKIVADISLNGYNPQGPVIDAMRTAFFDLPGIDDSIWSELSIWNRSFAKRIKTASLEITPKREEYKYRYIMQKDKNSPVVIIYPSVGEGYMSQHSVVLAKIFYEKGYSAIIQGSHFQWEFVKSMPDGYRPGVPTEDAKYLQNTTLSIVNALEKKYDCKFKDKVVIGTSFGAMMSLFLAELESKSPMINVNKYIAVNPPIELVYAMRQFDKHSHEWTQNREGIKEKAALTASKILKLLDSEDIQEEQKENLPFSEEEAKLITGFIMHQKLSDLIFTIENGSELKKYSDLYKMIYSMNYEDYVNKYMIGDTYKSIDDIDSMASLHVLESYLREKNNYRIYHSVDDYLVNSRQLMQLKDYCGEKLTIMSNGSHLGFLYRQEFIDSLRAEIPQNIKLVKEDS